MHPYRPSLGGVPGAALLENPTAWAILADEVVSDSIVINLRQRVRADPLVLASGKTCRVPI